MQKKRMRQALFILLLLIFIVSAILSARLAKQYLDARLRNQHALTYVKMYTAATKTASSEQSDLQVNITPPTINFTALQAANPDICAWLWIPQTAISYPVLHGKDNERYLNTAYDGIQSISGSIFMDFRNSQNFTDENTVLYGHNMKDHSMFGTLKKFRSQQYADEHRFIYLITPKQTFVYQVFAVYDTKAVDHCYTLHFSTSAARTAEITRAAKRSSVSLEFDPAQIERYLTLSTCTAGDSDRLVVQSYFVSQAQ